MRKFLAKRPTPAMAVAFVALLAALSGSAIALPGKNSVDSGDIKNGQVKTKDIKNNDVRSGDVRNGTLTGGDVKDDSLKGADIDESSLGQVPSAANANSANTANSANSANTANTANSAGSLSGGIELRRFHYESGASATPVTILSLHGLTLTATCTGSELSLQATTSVDDAALRGYGVQHGSFAPAFTNNVEQESANAGFQTGESVEILPNLQNDVRGTLAYYTDDHTVNVEYTSDEPGGGNIGQEFACVVTGHAIGS